MSPHLFFPLAQLPPRHAVAALLQAASALLARAAQGLVPVSAAAPAPSQAAPCIEFHADAGAPEGALYVDGRLVALLPGVTRL